MANKYFWTISVNGASAVPMDGFNKVRRTRRSLAISTVTMSEMLDDYADDTTLNWFDQISIFRNKVQWFYGWVTDIRRVGAENNHSASYTISDPWYFLEHTVFEQIYRLAITRPDSGGTPTAPTSGSFVGAGFSPAQIVDLSLMTTIDSSSGHWWSSSGGAGSSNPDNANTFIDSQGYYYYVGSTSHANINGFQTTDYLTYYQPSPGVYIRKNTQQQIVEVLEWCQRVYSQQNAGALPFSFSFGDITPAVDVPSSEVKDQMCAEIIKSQLGISPDAVTWFDYSVTPPALKIKQRGGNPSLSVVSYNSGILPASFKLVTDADGLTAANVSNFKSANIHPRYDLVAPVVVCNYEYTNTLQGQTYLKTVTDWYPTSQSKHQVNGLVSTLSMQGFSANGQHNKCLISNLPDLAIGGDDLSWTYTSPSSYNLPLYVMMQSQCELFNDPTITIVGIDSTPRGDVSGYITDSNGIYRPAFDFGRYVSQGQIADWMSLANCRETLNVTVRFRVNQGDEQLNNKTVTLVTTNYNYTGWRDFYDSSGDTFAEPIPIGLPQAVFSSCQQLQYDGSVSFEEDECSSVIGIGNTLNIQDPVRTEWASMNAMIVTVSEDLEHGQTDIEFGVTAHRGAADLVQILRALRTRVVVNRPQFAVGAAVSSGQTELGNVLATRDEQNQAGYNANQTFADARSSSGNPYSSDGTYSVPTLSINVPAPVSSYPTAGGQPARTDKPCIIFADQTGRKIAIRLGDVPENIKLKLQAAIFCDDTTGESTTGYAFFPDSSSGHF